MPRQPVIVPAPTAVDAERLDLSGFAQFAGELVLEREYDITDTGLSVDLVGRGMNSVSIAVNGKHVTTKLYPPYNVDLSEHLVKGKNTGEIRILNNLRNMMGPHHWHEGECVHVTPSHFFKESNIFHHREGADESCHDVLTEFWNDGYCMVHFGF